MKKGLFIKFAILLCLVSGVFAQSSKQDVVMLAVPDDNTPGLIKNLPDAENIRNRAIFTRNTEDLRRTLGERPIFDLIALGNGTDAAIAAYPQGKLLVVEYPTPQVSIDIDAQFKQRLAENPPTPPVYYRRIGNYSAFVFDAGDEASANALLDQVKFEKSIQWLGENPLPALYAEREFAIGTGEVFLSTVIIVGVGFSSTIVIGLIIGILFFYVRDQRRSGMAAFTDAGGMTRLNLDGLTSEALGAERLLKD